MDFWIVGLILVLVAAVSIGYVAYATRFSPAQGYDVVAVVFFMQLVMLYVAHVSRFISPKGGVGVGGGGGAVAGMEGFSSHPPTVEFYLMDGCPHCVAMKDTIEQLKKSGDVDVVEINAKDPRASAAGVKAFPAIARVTSGGSREFHKGARDAESILAFARR